MNFCVDGRRRLNVGRWVDPRERLASTSRHLLDFASEDANILEKVVGHAMEQLHVPPSLMPADEAAEKIPPAFVTL